MEEMLEDVLDVEDDEEIEEEADAEVDKVLYEITDGKLGVAGSVNRELPVCILLFSYLHCAFTKNCQRPTRKLKKRRLKEY